MSFSRQLIYDENNTGLMAAAGIAYIRLMFGCWWLYEVTLGKFWKLGSFSSGVNPKWVGEKAGEEILTHISKTIEGGIWGWYEWFLVNMVQPHADTWAIVIIVTQLMIAVSMIFGLFTRLSLVGAIVMLASINMIGSVSTSPIMIGGHFFLLFVNAGLFFGLDAFVLNRTKGIGFMSGIITFGNPEFSYRGKTIVISITSLLALWLVMQVTLLPDNLIRYVSLDMAALFTLLAIGFVFSLKEKDTTLNIAAAMLRLFVGYKLLWFILTNPHKKDLATLPGFLPGEALAALFEKSAASHVTFLQPLLTGVFEPYASFWSVVFGILQAGSAALLIIGWKPRLSIRIAMWTLFVFVLLGFTRYAPFLLSYCIGLAILDAGNAIGISGMLNRSTEATRSQNILKPAWLWSFLGIALLSLIMANVLGVEPNGYDKHVGATVCSAFAITFGMLFIVSFLSRTNQTATGKL